MQVNEKTITLKNFQLLKIGNSTLNMKQEILILSYTVLQSQVWKQPRVLNLYSHFWIPTTSGAIAWWLAQ